jgi:hypothetical protein
MLDESSEAKMKAALDGRCFMTPTFGEAKGELEKLRKNTRKNAVFDDFNFAEAMFSEHFDSHVKTMGGKSLMSG